MHYKKIVFLALISSFLSANTVLDKSILSKDRQLSLDLNVDQAADDSSKLKKDWINPITYKYTQLYDVGVNDLDSAKSYIGISQPIFRSGGIYNAIKYAYAMEKYKGLNIELQKQTMIKDALNILFQIEKTGLNIKKQELLVKNSELEVERKHEQVINGLLDSADLDSSILDLNTKRNTLLELIYAKEELINSFSNYSDKNFDEIKLPQFL